MSFSCWDKSTTKQLWVGFHLWNCIRILSIITLSLHPLPVLRSPWPSSRSQTVTEVQIQFRRFKGDKDVVLWLSVEGVRLRKMVPLYYLTSSSWVVKPSWTLKQPTSTPTRLYALSSSPIIVVFLLLLIVLSQNIYFLSICQCSTTFFHQLTLSCPPQQSAVALHLSHVLFYPSSHITFQSYWDIVSMRNRNCDI